jgi:hypothetical protein
MLTVGLDLAGVEGRPTGFCILKDMNAETSLVYKDEEIINTIEISKPEVACAQDVLEIPRKQRGLERLKAGLVNLGVKGLKERISDHELDAVTWLSWANCGWKEEALLTELQNRQ